MPMGNITYADETKIGDRIRARREELGLTQMEVVRKIGLSSASNYSPYETGHKLPSLSTLARIALALDTTLDFLYFGNDRKVPSQKFPDAAKIVDCFCYLLDADVLCEKMFDIPYDMSGRYVTTVALNKCQDILVSLLNDLRSYSAKSQYFDKTLGDMVKNRKQAAANEIAEKMSK